MTDRRTAAGTERAYVALAEALASTEWWDHGHVEDERDWTSRELAERALAALEADDTGRAAIVAYLLTPERLAEALEAWLEETGIGAWAHIEDGDAERLLKRLAAPRARVIFAMERHRYLPDAMNSGDCRICGHAYQDHVWEGWEIAAPAAPGYVDATATSGSYTSTPKTQPPAASVPAAEEEPRTEDGFSEYRCPACRAVLPASQTHWLVGVGAAGGYVCPAAQEPKP